MSENELDDILNEIKNKNSSNTDTQDFLKNKPAEKEEETISFSLSEPVTKSDSADESDFDLMCNNFSRTNDEPVDDKPDNDKKAVDKKKIAIIVIAVVAVIAIIAGVAFAVAKKNEKTPDPVTTAPPTTAQPTTEAPVIITNPLTGEADFNAKAEKRRPVACVVENSYYARPQWGIDDETASPDIIVEGEVEGGESRMLWMYADYTALPKQIGPLRSARPPFIRFSELFDSIFVHWGQSSSKGNYIGANTVFKQDNVDHINEMTTPGVGYLYGRDSSVSGRNSGGVEHTGVLYGDKLEQAIADCGFRTDADDKSYTKFSFNKKDEKLSDTACDTFKLTFSSRTGTREWAYNSDDKMYHTTDFSSNFGSSNVARKNLLVLFDTTSYVVKENYKNSGSSEVYCDYGLSGGNGKLASNGTVIDIKWSVSNGKLAITDTEGKKVNLNVGKTWIGYASSNNGGAVNIGTSEQ